MHDGEVELQGIKGRGGGVVGSRRVGRQSGCKLRKNRSNDDENDAST